MTKKTLTEEFIASATCAEKAREQLCYGANRETEAGKLCQKHADDIQRHLSHMVEDWNDTRDTTSEPPILAIWLCPCPYGGDSLTCEVYTTNYSVCNTCAVGVEEERKEAEYLRHNP